MSSRTYNPEKRAWRGYSYKKGGARVRDLRDAALIASSEGPSTDMATTIDVLISVSLVVGDKTYEAPSFTLALTDDPTDEGARLDDAKGTTLATAVRAGSRLGWNVTRAGAERIQAESLTLLSFAKPS